MGYKWEVRSWQATNLKADGEYKYIIRYMGDSTFKAIRKVITLRMAGIKCIKVHWRP